MSQRRVLDIVVDTLELHDLDADFNSKHDLTKNPNQLDLTIFNLSQNSRFQLTEAATRSDSSGVLVQLSAGYDRDGERDVGLIFRGRLRTVSHTKEGKSWVTKLTSGTGDELSQVVSFSVGPGASILDVIRIGLRDIQYVEQQAQLANFDLGKIKVGPGGLAAHGKSGEQIEQLLAEHNLSISVQNEGLQVLGKDSTTNDTSIQISSLTGMVDSPEVIGTTVTVDPDTNTRRVRRKIKVKTLLNADLYPGRKITVLTRAFAQEPGQVEETSEFKIEKVENQGSNYSQDWYSIVEAQELP